MSVAFTSSSPVPANGRLVITLSGAGLFVAPNTVASFSQPTNAAVSAVVTEVQNVLTITFFDDTDWAAKGAAIAFTISGVVNPRLVISFWSYSEKVCQLP